MQFGHHRVVRGIDTKGFATVITTFDRVSAQWQQGVRLIVARRYIYEKMEIYFSDQKHVYTFFRPRIMYMKFSNFGEVKIDHFLKEKLITTS